VGFLKSSAALPAVALGAGAHQIVPAVLASVMARDNVVYRQVSRLTTTVLASIVIPSKDLFLGELYPGARPLDHIAQLDHRGALKSGRRSADNPSAILQNLGFAHYNQGDSPFDIADVQRFVV